MSSEGPTIPEGWEQLPDDELIAAGHMYWHPWQQEWRDYDLHYGICTAGDYKNHGATVIRKKETADAK